MTRRKKILVVNPNSNETVTDGLRHSLEMFAGDADIDCCTLSDGPFGIESDEDIETVKPLIIDRIERSPEYDAYVIACYSDPGLEECRERFDKPVFGMQQSAVETAARGGRSFGVVALSDVSIRRHLKRIAALGFNEQLGGELPLDITVDQAANDPQTLQKVVTQGRRLIEEHGAESVVLGCAGMAAHREPAECALGVPVIEPAQAAVKLAIDSEDQ